MARATVFGAGAMGTAEMCAWGIPAVLVPLPTAAADHQSVNARTLAAAGAAIHIEQSRFTAELLDRTLRELMSQPDELRRLAAAAEARARPNAAVDIARRIASIMDSGTRG